MTTTATGAGSWPGNDIGEALRVIRGELADPAAGPDGVQGLPYLPVLPQRGLGADRIGRTAGLLVEMPVDVGQQGWRLVARPGRDAERTAAWWRQDLDLLAETFDGWSGELKVQFAGPWTLAAALWLQRGDRVLVDPGAVRDLADSLAEGLRGHLQHLQQLVPGAGIVVQLDEPSLGAVLRGRIRSDSGIRTLPAPDAGQASALLESVAASAREAGAVQVAVRCGGKEPPVAALRAAGPDAIAVDTHRLTDAAWEQLAEAVEAGVRCWAGALPVDGASDPAAAAAALLASWRRIGLAPAGLRSVAITPAGGLDALSPASARAVTAATVEVARRLAEQE